MLPSSPDDSIGSCSSDVLYAGLGREPKAQAVNPEHEALSRSRRSLQPLNRLVFSLFYSLASSRASEIFRETRDIQ